MPDLPTCFAGLILAFKPLFVHRSWRHAQILMIGAILTPGQRTVTSVLRIMGRAQDRRFVNVHRILNRAAWCPRTGGRILLGLLIAAFVPRGPVVLGIDDTIERRRGRRIAAKGIYRDSHAAKLCIVFSAALPEHPHRRNSRRAGGRAQHALRMLASDDVPHGAEASGRQPSDGPPRRA